MKLELIAALASLAFGPALQAGVLKVSPAGPGDFRQIRDAVTAAADGDMILVEPGDYDSFSVTDKSLDIEADGGPCTVAGVISILSLEPGKTVVVRDLDALPKRGPDLGEGLRIQDCAGDVLVEGGVFIGTSQDATANPYPGVSITSSTAVSMHGCRIVGGKNLMTATIKAGAGLDVSGASIVSLWDCNCGGESSYGANGSPAPGATVDGGTLFASGTIFAGGDQNGFTAQCEPGADGLDLEGGAQAQLLADMLNGGTGSKPKPPFCPSGGPAGLPLHVDEASGSGYEIVPGSARGFTATSPVREGQTLSFSFHGQPAELAVLLASFSTGYLWVGGLHGTLLVGSPFMTLPLGPTDALGNFSFSTTVPELGPGVAGVALYCQGFFHLVGKSIGPASTVLLLDAAY